MTKIRSANIGSYPRIGEEKDQQRLRRALAHRQNGELSAHAFHDVENSVIQEVIREQLLTGLDEITDGGVSWHDPVSHFCRKVSGIHLRGLARYFDTNTYYRVPVFTGKPRRRESHVASAFQLAKSIASKPVRTVLTGPYTLARLSASDVKPFRTIRARIDFFSDLLSTEISLLRQDGADVIQIDEPALPRFPDDFHLAAAGIRKCASSASPARFILAMYFAPLASIYDYVRTLPVDALNLDFTYDGKKLFETLLNRPAGPAIGFGLVDGRNTRMEPIDPLLKILRRWIDRNSPELLYVTPSCGLEYLPRTFAFDKLKLIQKIKSELSS